MYSISPQLVDNFASNDSLNDLLSQIDNKILLIAGTEYNAVRFGFLKHVNMDRYHDLKRYKEILLEKLLGCNCLEDQMLIMIVEKIKKLLN